MNEDIIQGKWKQISGSLKEKWGDLTDNDVREIDGQREKLVGKVQERYGIERQEAERQVEEFERRYRQP